MFFFPESDIASMSTWGLAAAVDVGTSFEIGLAYSRASVSFLGIELMSVSLVDAYLGTDLSRDKAYGLFLHLGASYLQANALGEGLGGVLGLVGVGFRMSPISSLDLFGQYTGRFKYGLLSTFEAGAYFRF
jgi:hypothetical protein